MAVIVFYDTTELDKQQLTDGLRPTDHYWEFAEGEISTNNCNPNAEIISVFTTSTVTREMIESMPKLVLIACRSTGYNHIDLEAANDHNVKVVNVPTYGESTVAEYAFTLLLAVTRKIEQVLDAENEKFTPENIRGTDLAGKTIGIIGTGHIGQKAINIANGFSMNVIAYDAYPKESLQSELNFKYVSLDDLLAQSDVVSLHIPYMPATHHILNEKRLAAMKRGAYLVNTARGALVETGALIELLSDGHLGGAAIDVIEGEKLLSYDEETDLLRSNNFSEDTLRHSVEISALKKMPNVIVSPHNAYNTVEAIGRINKITADNITSFYFNDIPNLVPYKKQAYGKLVLIRHTESEWNACGVWSGIADVGLSEKGKQDYQYLGTTLKKLGIKIDVGIHTKLSRTEETLKGICQVLGDDDITVICDDGVMERDYGQYTGQDKWKLKEELGEEHWQQIRRGWDVPVPNGETLKMVYERVVPAYQERILPLLKKGKNVLVVGHGNSFRALMKHLETIPDDAIERVEMLLNQIVVYEIDAETGLAKSGQTIIVDTPTGKSELA